MDGGTGLNTAAYTSSNVALTVNLATHSATHGIYADTLTNIQNVLGGNLNDTITGDVNDNLLDGALGDDSLVGGLGKDTLIGGAGNDTLDGAGGAGQADSLVGGANNDTYFVDSNLDVITETLTGSIDTVNIQNITSVFKNASRYEYYFKK